MRITLRLRLLSRELRHVKNDNVYGFRRVLTFVVVSHSDINKLRSVHSQLYRFLIRKYSHSQVRKHFRFSFFVLYELYLHGAKLIECSTIDSRL